MISNLVSGWSWWWEEAGNNHEDKVTGLAVSMLVAILVTAWYVIRRWRRNEQLPPGPRGLLLVGNLFSVEAELHLYFAKLARVYGPILKVQLGGKCCVVISSSSLAKNILKDQDATFANRDPPIAALIVTYGANDMGWSSSDDPVCRKLRFLCKELLSNANLDSCHALRQREVQQTLKDLHSNSEIPIDVGEKVFVTILNVIMSMLWGGTLQGEERASVGVEFREAIAVMVNLIGKPNVSDLFPVLQWFDIQGIERQAKNLSGWIDRIFESVIDRRMQMDKAKDAQTESKDFVKFLLELMEQQDSKTQITKTQLKALFMTDTMSAMLEWAMAEMMQHPEIMRKAQAELEEVVGTNNMVEESHTSKFRYLDAIVKETMRLHPVVPLLVPHSPSSSCIVGGYNVPKGARLFFNVWAMHRDPEAWENPLDFQPERFLTSDSKKFDLNGKNFNYLPFGSGRRICPGLPLAQRMTTYVLASLLHSFDWRSPEGTKLDLTEKFGIVLKKSTPLVAIPSPRLSNPELYK